MAEAIVSWDFWQDRQVLVTGHTGFKGSWLCAWLARLGARVRGIALNPPTQPSLYEEARLASAVDDVRLDLRDEIAVRSAVVDWDPDVILHLAAQPIVRASYRMPLETFSVNVMGTAYLLEAARFLSGRCAVVIVTSDKCYENEGSSRAFRESDPMGGSDPYSASKGCAELVTAAYRRAFFASSSIQVATARAGNVIGGGDWAPDRLLPDLVRDFINGQPACVRNPTAVRPWQHVLEPLHGYLTLAQRLWESDSLFAAAWNFGPAAGTERDVAELADRLVELWGEGASWVAESTRASELPEAPHLALDGRKTAEQLGWQPCWTLEQALSATVSWYSAWAAGQDAAALIAAQIDGYMKHREIQSRPVSTERVCLSS